MHLLFILVAIILLTEARKTWYHKVGTHSSSDEDLEKLVYKKTKRKEKKSNDSTLDFFDINFRNNEQLSEEKEIENYMKLKGKTNSIQKNPDQPDHLEYIPIQPLYINNSFDSEPKTQDNWTTCAEFGHNAFFQAKGIVDLDWIPFYSWSVTGALENVAYVHTFSFASTKLVEKYKKDLGPYLNKSLEWEGDHLYMKSDLNMLLMAGQWVGEYNGIPYTDVPKTIKRVKISLPIINLRMKAVDQYLALMFCDHQYATIMAMYGSEPTTIDEIRTEAAKLNFKGRGEFPVIKQSEQVEGQSQLDIQVPIDVDMASTET